MGSEVYQAQVIKAFINAITGTDRSITQVSLCVITLAKLRNESPETLKHLMDQLQKSKQKHTVSIDVIDYVADVANSFENKSVLAAFGIPENTVSEDFGGISLDSL